MVVSVDVVNESVLELVELCVDVEVSIIALVSKVEVSVLVLELVELSAEV